jgi:hypothetical protein
MYEKVLEMGILIRVLLVGLCIHANGETNLMRLCRFKFVAINPLAVQERVR